MHLSLVFSIFISIIIGLWLTYMLKCHDVIIEKTCNVTHYEVVDTFYKEKIFYQTILIIYCYESMCDALQILIQQPMHNLTNINCWYINNDLRTLTIDNIEQLCRRKTFDAIFFGILVSIAMFVCLFTLITMHFSHNKIRKID